MVDRGAYETAVAFVLRLEGGYSDSPILANMQEYGFCAQLSKPYRKRDLQALLYEVLHKPTP